MTEADDFSDRLGPKQVAGLIGVSIDTLRRVQQSDPTFPAFICVSPRRRFVLRRDVLAWLARRRLEAVEAKANLVRLNAQ